MELIRLIALMGEPYGPHPLGRGLGWVGNMTHIGRPQSSPEKLGVA